LWCFFYQIRMWTRVACLSSLFFLIVEQSWVFNKSYSFCNIVYCKITMIGLVMSFYEVNPAILKTEWFQKYTRLEKKSNFCLEIYIRIGFFLIFFSGCVCFQSAFGVGEWRKLLKQLQETSSQGPLVKLKKEKKNLNHLIQVFIVAVAILSSHHRVVALS